MSVEPLSYLWKFGDGLSSTLSHPDHTYAMSGTYDWELTVTFPGNNLLKVVGIEYVYDNDYSSKFIISRTNRCFRFAIPDKIEQGIGWSEYDGDDWPYPVGRSGKCRIKDNNEMFRNFVIDGNNFKVHELGIINQWKDGETDYGGSEIESEILLKERVPPIGASAILEHEQSHAYLKPYDKEKRDIDDYNSEGFRTVFNMDAYIRVDSKITDAAITKIVPIKGQLVFDKPLKSPNLQIGWILRGAPWRFIKTQTWYKQIDSAASPDNKLMSEMKWMLEWSELITWLARNRLSPLLDSATGIVANGTIVGIITGPDGFSTSAINLGFGDTITITNISIIGDGTLSIWLSNIIFPLILFTIGTFVVTLQPGVILNITDGVNVGTVNLNHNYISWTLLTITREGAIIRVYENGILTNTIILGSIIPIVGDLTISGMCMLSDLRIKNNKISSESILYLYSDMINNRGNGSCPII